MFGVIYCVNFCEDDVVEVVCFLIVGCGVDYVFVMVGSVLVFE